MNEIELNDSCPDCGNTLTLFTEEEGGFYYDGDRVECCECGFTSYINVYEDGYTIAD